MSLKDLLLTSNLHFLLFGGKGGVGKTTCAVSTAIYAADHGKKVLIISTDPAHSLADSLGQNLNSGEITKIEDVENLWAMELKSKIEDSQLESFMGQADSTIAPMLSMLGNVGDVTPPGMDEAMAFGKVLEFLQDTDYDLIIFDTAPTGHTLRLLGIPDMLSSWTGKMLKMRLTLGKFLGSFKSLFSKGSNEDGDALESIEKLKESIEIAKEELSDPEKTSFIIVLIPELMVIYETERLLNTLMQYEISVDNMIINQIVPKTTDCSFCKNRSSMQQKHVKEIEDLYKDEYNLIQMELFSSEVRKIDKLREFAQILCEK
jgi:arsenite-transporting ATPase